jgi:hypothetical protein
MVTMGLCVWVHLAGMKVINVISVYDLLGLAMLSGISFVFFLAWLTCGRRRIDLVFGTLISCSAIVCGITFLADNLVLVGHSAVDKPWAARAALMIGWGQWGMAILALALEIHFVLVYCGLDRKYRKALYGVYALAIAALPGVFHPGFLKQASKPNAPVASVSHLAVWLAEPQTGAMLCLVAWVVVNAGILVLLHRQKTRKDRFGPYRCIHLVQWAIAVQAIGVLGDITQAFFSLSTLSTYVACAMISAMLLSAALVRERIESSRKILYDSVKDIKNSQAGTQEA